ncbi:uncharacterized protein LOC129100707 [Anoplopoma fimbria]|uniref:uncharacterized protein LOC129100707 n=1 Tax=Anoplopoma fimbria TaxID=229290 RepID=UPI0023EA7B49|nr:uncharacterized protein LOC129100707 [Anoplopoma fimbria]
MLTPSYEESVTSSESKQHKRLYCQLLARVELAVKNDIVDVAEVIIPTMSSVESFREFVTERLTAAAQEIFGVFEKTIFQYEEEVDRQRRLLDIVWKPAIKLHRIVSVPRAAPPAPSSDSQQQVWTVLNSALDISDILSDDLCFGEDGRLVTSTPNGTLPIFEDSLQLGPSIDAIADLISVPELMDMDLQPPSATASDPQPSATASDPQPSATASDPQPSATASDPQPSATASDPQPSATASDPQPSVTASDPQPSVTASDPQPSAPATDPQPFAPRMRPRAPCGVKCRRQCSTHFSEERRMTICREFWGLSYKDKRAFVFHSVSQMGREKVCARPSRRGRTFVYRLKDAKENPHQVCKLFYLSTLGYHPGNDSIVLSVMQRNVNSPSPTARWKR